MGSPFYSVQLSVAQQFLCIIFFHTVVTCPVTHNDIVVSFEVKMFQFHFKIDHY